MKEKYANMNDNQKEKVLLDLKLKRMMKYIRLGCWAKAYQQTDFKQSINLDDPHYA